MRLKKLEGLQIMAESAHDHDVELSAEIALALIATIKRQHEVLEDWCRCEDELVEGDKCDNCIAIEQTRKEWGGE